MQKNCKIKYEEVTLSLYEAEYVTDKDIPGLCQKEKSLSILFLSCPGCVEEDAAANGGTLLESFGMRLLYTHRTYHIYISRSQIAEWKDRHPDAIVDTLVTARFPKRDDAESDQ